MAVNITSIEISSSGVWLGDNPLHCAFPLLIIQTILILAVTRTLAFIFKPLRQPRVVAEILGGVLLGPSALGRNQEYMKVIFPSWSSPILGSVANLGLVFFLFLVGIELDLTSIRRSGRRAAAIGVTGIATTFGCGAALAAVLHKTVDSGTSASYANYTIFMGVAISITAFPVLARILAELKLLTTRIGETAMAAAALNDVAAWVFLAVVVALAGDGGDGPKKSPATPAWILLSGVGFVVFMMVAVKPAMRWVGRKCSSEYTVAEEAYICLTLAGVLASGFMTDMIGIHSIFGAFVFGLTIPKDGDFATKLTEKIEDFVSGLLLPLYFASSGLKTDVSRISSSQDVELLVLAIAAACTGKILGTFAVSMLCRIPARESLTLGFLMNTKGLVELIVLNIGREAQVIGDEAFTILVIMAIFTTFLTTPTVMAIYRPSPADDLDAKPSLPSTKTDKQAVLACVHGPEDVPAMINLIELTRPTEKSSRMNLFIMHLTQLTDLSSSIIKFQRWRRNGIPLIRRLAGRSVDPRSNVATAFEVYGKVGRARTMLVTAVSPLATMHEDICRVVNENNVSLVLLPFHKKWRSEEEEIVAHGWGDVNQLVLQETKTAVGVLVDRRSLEEPTDVQNICVLFSGGADDRKALEIATRMAKKAAVKVTVIRLKQKASDSANQEQDENSIREFEMRCGETGEIVEKTGADVSEEIVGVGKSGAYSLIVVGKGTSETESSLGAAGDLLAASGKGIVSSVLVVQAEKQENKMDYTPEMV